MRKIIKGVRTFQREVYPHLTKLFHRLAQGQHPRAMFITCSDARVNPYLITQSEPGELFVMRNPGNLVPPPGSRCEGVDATIQYAVSILKVKHVIVCGHSDCGAMRALLHPESVGQFPELSTWLRHARRVQQAVQRKRHLQDDQQELLTAAIEQNVLLQLESLGSHPCVSAAVAAGDLQLHGWVYHIGSGEVLAYDNRAECFGPLV